MANTKQQSSEAPQGGMQGQQGGGRVQASPDTNRGSQTYQGRGSQNMPAQRGSYELGHYGGGGGGPFAMMRRISDEMDRLFESFGMGGMGPVGGGFGPGMPAEYGAGLRTLWAPRIEVRERDGKLLIQADLPGVRKEDVNVRVEQDAVIIEGERRQESEREDQGYYHSERSYGSFHRTIPLPEGIDADQAKATFRDGVLDIELPAPRQRTRGRALTIEDGGSARGDAPRGGASSGGRQQG
jgi:HSP20 family protein